jgi:hypothetical protein
MALCAKEKHCERLLHRATKVALALASREQPAISRHGNTNILSHNAMQLKTVISLFQKD